MQLVFSRMAWALAGAGVVTIYGCGGGGDSSSVPVSDSASSITLSGVAATGAAFGGATVTATDAAGTATSCGTTDATTGGYSCTIPASAKAPIVVEASRADSGEAFYSVAAEKKTSTVNVTPITTAIVAGLSPTGNPSGFKDELKNDNSLASVAKLQTQVTLLETKLAAVIKAATAAGFTFDPLAGTFTAGSGTGMDKILDAIKVSTTAGSSGVTANVTISLRADPDATVNIKKGEESAATPMDSAKVTAVQTTIDEKPATLIAEFFDRMNACYALPVAERVDNQSTGTAANIIAAKCKTIFKGDDPANFKSGGNLVGAKAAFRGIFSTTATGVKFDRGNLEYVVNNPGAANNGYWIVSYRSTDASGNVSFDTWALIKEGSGTSTKLKQAGNQHEYDTSVKAFVQHRDFINTPTNNYLSTGYSVNLTNKNDAKGNSLFKQVVVTSPKDKKMVLKPTSGISFLGLVQNPGVEGSEKTLSTNVVRMSYGYSDTTKNGDYPAGEANYLFFVPTKWTDADIAAIPDQGTWTFEITLADGTVVTQKSRTIARAPTLAEVRKTKFVELTAAQKTDVTSNTGNGYYLFSDATKQVVVNPGSDAWSVPVGAFAPTAIQVFGNLGVSGSTFNDSVTVASSARTVTIPCSRQSNSDAHCAASVSVGGSGNFAAGTRVTELQLNANTPRGTVSKHNAFYTPTP